MLRQTCIADKPLHSLINYVEQILTCTIHGCGPSKIIGVCVFLPTATMPLSRSPDISLQMLFSISLPHICWYSRNTTDTHTHTYIHTHTHTHTQIQTHTISNIANKALNLHFWPDCKLSFHLFEMLNLMLDSACEHVFIKNTCSEMGFAPGTQNRVKFGLICSKLVFSSSIQGLYREQQCVQINVSLQSIGQVISNIKTTKSQINHQTFIFNENEADFT